MSCQLAGMKMPSAFLSAGEHVRAPHDLMEMRRADFFLALGDQHDVDRQFHLGGFGRHEARRARWLQGLLIHGAATDDGAAETGLVDDAAFERRATTIRPDRTASRRT